MASFAAATCGDLLVTLEKKSDGIYSRRYSMTSGQPVAFSDNTTEKKVIQTSAEFAVVPMDQGLIAVILQTDRSFWLSRDAGESFEQIGG